MASLPLVKLIEVFTHRRVGSEEVWAGTISALFLLLTDYYMAGDIDHGLEKFVRHLRVGQYPLTRSR